MAYLLGKIVCMITALVAINIGANTLFGFDAFAAMPLMWLRPVNIVIGLAGVLGLLMCFDLI